MLPGALPQEDIEHPALHAVTYLRLRGPENRRTITPVADIAKPAAHAVREDRPASELVTSPCQRFSTGLLRACRTRRQEEAGQTTNLLDEGRARKCHAVSWWFAARAGRAFDKRA